MLKQINKIHIFDPCFGNMTGHWENYCKRLYHELIDRGYTAKVYGQSRFDEKITSGVSFVPVFECSTYETLKNVFDFYRYTDSFLGDFNKIKASEFEDHDLLIFHSIFPQTLSAIIKWTKALAATKKVKIAIFLQFPPSESKKQISSLRRKLYYLAKGYLPGNKKNNDLEWLDNNTVRFYQMLSDELNELISNGSYLLFSSTDMLTANFAAMLRAPVHCLPMPGPKLSQALKTQKNDEAVTITIGYFGHSSLAKGGQFLWYLVGKIASRHPEVKFILHINPNPETEVYLEPFKWHSYSNVVCHFGHLEQSKLLELMNQVDIILMPYSPEKYMTTPSAIFTEGMPLKKIFILPENTWVHAEAVKYQAGFTGFKKQHHRSIYKALLAAINNFKELKERSVCAGEKFYLKNNILNYINRFEAVLNNEKLMNEREEVANDKFI